MMAESSGNHPSLMAKLDEPGPMSVFMLLAYASTYAAEVITARRFSEDVARDFREAMREHVLDAFPDDARRKSVAQDYKRFHAKFRKTKAIYGQMPPDEKRVDGIIIQAAQKHIFDSEGPGEFEINFWFLSEALENLDIRLNQLFAKRSVI